MHALVEELTSLRDKATWVEDGYPNSLPLPMHVILKVKKNADAWLDQFQARIVANGNHQTNGQDYVQTYASVVSFKLVHIFLYVMLCLQILDVQVGIRIAFLTGELEEDVGVTLPRCILGLKSQCYKLRKAIYGLNHVHLAGHTKFSTDTKGIGFEDLPSAPFVSRRQVTPMNTFRCMLMICSFSHLVLNNVSGSCRS